LVFVPGVDAGEDRNKGRRVVEADVVVLTEVLMNDLVKLDADGDVKA
jgi:hypothetical protein